MAATVYVLGVFTSMACAVLLLRGFLQSRQKLLLWSGICFAIFAVSNLLIFVDLVVFPELDLYRYRLVTAAVAMGILVYGLIWESD
jgi:hypothetical protein